MKEFIRNLENKYLAAAILIIGILMVVFPIRLAAAFPWALGSALIVRAVVVIILFMKYREEKKGPGRVLLYLILGFTFLLNSTEATGIIGIIWAAYTLVEVANEIDEMWHEKRFSVLYLFMAAASIVLSVLLLLNPFEHFAVHIRVFGMEVIFYSLSRIAAILKMRKL